MEAANPAVSETGPFGLGGSGWVRRMRKIPLDKADKERRKYIINGTRREMAEEETNRKCN